MHMGAENMAKKAAKRKNTRKNTGSRKNGGRNRLWIIFAGCCIALAVAAVFQNLCGDIFLIRWNMKQRFDARAKI